jgi:DNA repair and recombination protein RAD52
VQTITEHQRRQLSEDLPRDVVRTRDQAGQRLSYVDGWYAVTRANDVFGPDGWSYAVREVREVYRGTKPGKGTDENTVIVYEALVAVTALGITREDVGIGQCDASIRALAQGIEKARKESVTDGLKRALRTFGPSFGLALYDKDQRDVGISRAAMDLRADLEHAADVDAWVQQHGAAVRALADDERDELRALVMRRREEAAREAAVRAAAVEVQQPRALPPLASLGVEVQAPATTPAPVEARDLVAEVRDSAAVRHTVRELADLWRGVREELKAAKLERGAWDVVVARCKALELIPKAVTAEIARLDAQDRGPGPKGGTPRPEAPAHTDATGTGQDVAPAAAAVALVPTWCSDVDAMERHIEGYSHAVAVERCARKHRAALPRAARELLALRLQRLSWDPHDGEITLESARELVSRWIAQGPVERVRPEARAKVTARRAVG